MQQTAPKNIQWEFRCQMVPELGLCGTYPGFVES